MTGAAVLLAISGFLIDARGDVALHRLGASRPSPANAGAELRPGDTIHPRKDAKARILCPDLLTTWEPAPATESGVFEECPRFVERPRVRDGQPALGVRDAERRAWVRTPSNTTIADARPVIRWNAIPGVARYRVSVLQAGNPPQPIWGPALAEGSSIEYSGSRPLVPGSQYFVRVEAEGTSVDGKPFVIAPASLQNEVSDRVRHFEHTIADPRARQIATSIYLQSRNFRAGALMLMEELTGAIQSPDLKLLHARCLAEVGDYGAQRDVLNSALNEAERMRDAYNEAAVLLELVRIEPKRDQAERMSRRARELLNELGIRKLPGGD